MTSVIIAVMLTLVAMLFVFSLVARQHAVAKGSGIILAALIVILVASVAMSPSHA